MEKYHQQIKLEGFGSHSQQKLQKGRVLVVGAGGLGCPVLQTLNAMGIGTLGISDSDRVHLNNLYRQPLYTPFDVGEMKTKVAKKWLERQNPETTIHLYPRLTSLNSLSLCRDYDVIVDATDNFPSRYLINDTCLELDLPFVSGGVEKYKGQLATFNWNKSPSYRDLFPSPRIGCGNCQQEGVIGVLPAIIGHLQAMEVIKILTGLASPLAGKLLMIDTRTLQSSIYHFKKQTTMHVQTIRFEEVKKLPCYALLDVREIEEREEEHIGGRHIPCQDLPSQLDSLDRSIPLVIYCQHGIRSHWAAHLVLTHFPNMEVYSLEGGLENLK